MVTIEFSNKFKKDFKKIKDTSIKIQLRKQIQKAISNPKIGKPMRYARKNTRELYVNPYRLSYSYLKEENKLILLDLYHKELQ